MNFGSFEKKNTASAIIVAAGNGTRMNSDKSKQLLEICRKPLVAHSLIAFENSPHIGEIVIVTRETDILVMSDIVREFNISKVTDIVKGGSTRAESVKIGILHAKNDFVAIHDGARPCVKPQNIEDTLSAAFKSGAAALGCRVCDTLKLADENNFIVKTVSRENLWQIQTPQVFERGLLLKAYETADIKTATDDCMLVESMGVKVTIVEGDKSNIKVTFPGDVSLAEAVLKGGEV